MKLVEVLHCSHHGPKPNSGEQQEKRVVDGKERRRRRMTTSENPLSCWQCMILKRILENILVNCFFFFSLFLSSKC
jgi:hypothetical protein